MTYYTAKEIQVGWVLPLHPEYGPSTEVCYKGEKIEVFFNGESECSLRYQHHTDVTTMTPPPEKPQPVQIMTYGELRPGDWSVVGDRYNEVDVVESVCFVDSGVKIKSTRGIRFSGSYTINNLTAQPSHDWFRGPQLKEEQWETVTADQIKPGDVVRFANASRRETVTSIRLHISTKEGGSDSFIRQPQGTIQRKVM